MDKIVTSYVVVAVFACIAFPANSIYLHYSLKEIECEHQKKELEYNKKWRPNHKPKKNDYWSCGNNFGES